MSISFTKKVFLLISILSLSMLVTANQWGVLETSEARYAEISREMQQSGDWMHPTLLGIHHYHKPPVTYWITAASFSLFGVNDFALRFFLTIAFGLQVYLVFLIAKSIFENEESAWFSSLVYASLPIILISVRGLTTDAFLTTFILLAIYFLIQLLKTGSPKHLYFMVFFLGIGFLTKGPVIFILPAFVAISFWKWFPNKAIAAYHYFFGLLFFILIGFSWFVVVIYQEPKLADYFFFRHFVDRIANAEVFVRSKPWYYYLPLVPLISIPWIGIFISGFFNLRKYYSTKDFNLIVRLTIGWIVLPLLFFSISSSKLVLYIIPIFIGFSLVTGSFITARSFRNFSSVLILVGIIYSALAIGPFVVPSISMPWWTACIPLVCLGITIWYWINRKTGKVAYDVLPILFTVNLIVYGAIFLQHNNTTVNGMKEVSTFITEKNMAGREILVYDEILPSLSFELKREIISIHAGQHTLKREVQFENTDKWRSTLIDVTDSTEQKRFNEYLSKKIVLVKKSKEPFSPDSIATTGNWNSQVIGKWTVYYN